MTKHTPEKNGRQSCGLKNRQAVYLFSFQFFCNFCCEILPNKFPNHYHFFELDPIIYSDECEISFSDVMQIDRNISDHDATSASLRIPYNLQAKYQREVWLYKHADFINLNSEIRLGGFFTF